MLVYLENGKVCILSGFGDVYKVIVEGGWVLSFVSLEFGGMGLLLMVMYVVNEMMVGVCLFF